MMPRRQSTVFSACTIVSTPVIQWLITGSNAAWRAASASPSPDSTAAHIAWYRGTIEQPGWTPIAPAAAALGRCTPA